MGTLNDTLQNLIKTPLGDAGLLGAIHGASDRAVRDSLTALALRSAIEERREGDRFHCAYQPIFVGGKIFAFEALLRCGMRDIAEVFEVARATGGLEALDLKAAALAITGTRGWLGDRALFVNMSEKRASDVRAFLEGLMAQAAGVMPPTQITVEISERQTSATADALKEALAPWRDSGLSVALDDVVLGVRVVNLVRVLRPEWIKIDGSLVRRLGDRGVDDQVRGLVSLAADNDCQVIGEQVETAEQQDRLAALNVLCLQGFGLQKPITFPQQRGIHAAATNDRQPAPSGATAGC